MLIFRALQLPLFLLLLIRLLFSPVSNPFTAVVNINAKLWRLACQASCARFHQSNRINRKCWNRSEQAVCLSPLFSMLHRRSESTLFNFSILNDLSGNKLHCAMFTITCFHFLMGIFFSSKLSAFMSNKKKTTLVTVFDRMARCGLEIRWLR